MVVADCPGHHIFLKKLLSLIQDSSTLMIRGCCCSRAIIFNAYCCRSTRQRSELDCTGTFLTIRYPSPRSVLRMLRTSECLTSKSVCSFTRITILSAFGIGMLYSSIYSASALIAARARLFRSRFFSCYLNFSGSDVASFTSRNTSWCEIQKIFAISCCCWCSSTYSLTISLLTSGGSCLRSRFLHFME